ncbi:MAG: 5'/3'-nucleotidase SurE [Fimbriimonadaceae bacterium]|nr:5'/3'-nucleotidase SurE [Fimbriimonadaceae bacterium]
MRILITNDDGIHGPGLRALALAAAEIGDVKIVAPERERSACGHAMTMREPLRVHRAGSWHDFEAHEVNGLPVDCVNVGLTEIWPDGCDLVLSGINNGPNLGFDITYSGTVAGAMEGCINGIRSFSFSMAMLDGHTPPHFETGTAWIARHWETLLALPHEPLLFWNVNIPARPLEEVGEPRFCRMGERVYKDRVERRSDPWGRPYWWQGGIVVMDPSDPTTDVGTVAQGGVSLTPISLDWTRHDVLDRVRGGATSRT